MVGSGVGLIRVACFASCPLTRKRFLIGSQAHVLFFMFLLGILFDLMRNNCIKGVRIVSTFATLHVSVQKRFLSYLILCFYTMESLYK